MCGFFFELLKKKGGLKRGPRNLHDLERILTASGEELVPVEFEHVLLFGVGQVVNSFAMQSQVVKNGGAYFVRSESSRGWATFPEALLFGPRVGPVWQFTWFTCVHIECTEFFPLTLTPAGSLSHSFWGRVPLK